MLQLVVWLLLAALHVLPALAFVRPSLITTLYGVPDGSVVFVLLQHRAALFAVIVLVAVWAAFVPEVRRLAVVAAGFSMLSFLLLYAQAGAPPALKTIAIADLLGLPLLAVAAYGAFAR